MVVRRPKKGLFTNRDGKRLNRFIRAIYFNRGIRRRFQEDPERCGETFGISPDLVEAIKKKDWSYLIGKGMTPKLMVDPAYRLIDKFRLGYSRMAYGVIVFLFGILAYGPMARARRILSARWARDSGGGWSLRMLRRDSRTGARRSLSGRLEARTFDLRALRGRWRLVSTELLNSRSKRRSLRFALDPRAGRRIDPFSVRFTPFQGQQPLDLSLFHGEPITFLSSIGGGTDPKPVPEPSTLALIGGGLTGLSLLGRFRKRWFASSRMRSIRKDKA